MFSWLRAVNILSLTEFTVITLAWTSGGWLLVTGLFNLHPRSRLIGGITTGLILFQVLVNLITRYTGLPLACAFSAALILAGGLATLPYTPDWKYRLKGSLSGWPSIIGLAAFTYIFYLLGRGISLFDDYEHLPMISTMATGDIPPHFYLNPGQYFAYHYGLQVWAASLVRMTGAFPWVAWDFAKAFAIALTLLLGWLWVRQITRSPMAANVGAFLFVFAGGARWLLLLLPLPVLGWIQQSITLSNTGIDSGANLIQALSSPWVTEGLGKVPVPFAFHSGFFLPVEFYLGATGAMPFATVLLLLLLKVPRKPLPFQKTILPVLLLGLIYANLALNAEHLFVFLCAAVFVVMVIHSIANTIQKKPVDWYLMLNWLIILLTGGVLSLIQGGFITEAARSLLSGFGTHLGSSNNVYHFSLRWPPSLASGHFGELSPFNLRQLPVLLAELGPAILFIPIVTHWAWRAARRGDWLITGLGFTAIASLVFAMLFQYGIDRSSTRLPGTALWLWVVLAFPLLYRVYQTRGKWIQGALLATTVALVFEGVITFGVQLTSASQPQTTYFIDPLDAAFTRAYWNQLDSKSQILDHIQYRAVTIFGRAATANQSIFETLPEWDALIKNPDPAVVSAAGFKYIYMDNPWWQQVPDQTKKLFDQTCVNVVSEKKDLAYPTQNYRILWDVSTCRH